MGKRKKEELPDYTVADMDLEGMPWNSKKMWQIFPGDPWKKRQRTQSEKENPYAAAYEQPPMTAKERRSAIWLALKASLLVASVFGIVALAFILFCVFVWFK